jgi:prepilin-type N-terminal cleavage/methylation domain-containing protein
MQRSRDRESAFTLFEVLIAVTIILIVTAIALPVLFRAKHSAWKTDEISHLRQLAIAGQLYSDQFGEFPLSTVSLYGSGYGIEKVVLSRRDPYPRGFVNAYIAWENANNTTAPTRPLRNYEVTYAGFGDFYPVPPMADYFSGGPLDYLLADHRKLAAERADAGWLVSIGEGGGQAHMKDLTLQFRKPVLRLTFEGAVVRRPSCAIMRVDGTYGYGPRACFFDAIKGDLNP